MEYLRSIPQIREILEKRRPMTKTKMAKTLAKGLHVEIREAFRLVNNCIRDRIIVAVEWPKEEDERRKVIKWIIIRNMTDVEKDNEELERFYDDKYKDGGY